MKQIITKIILILIMLLMILPFLSNKSDSVTWTNRPFYTYTFWGSNSDQNIAEYDRRNNNYVRATINDWTGITHVYIKENGENGGNAYGYSLRQYNVFCVEEGAVNVYGQYKVGEEIDVDDNILSYILYKGANTGVYGLNNLENSGTKLYQTNEQKMLWGYLYNMRNSNHSTAINAIKNGADIIENTYNYAEASNYNTYLNNFAPTVSIVDNNDGRFKITVTGADTSKEYISYTLSYKVNGGNSQSITTTKGINTYYIDKVNGKIDVTLNANFTKYKAKFRLLTRAKNQRVLVVTKTGTEIETKKATASISTATNVSMQKYISAVYKPDSKGTYTVDGAKYKRVSVAAQRTFTKATEAAKDVANKDIFMTETKNYIKSGNPVEITAGDIVEYKIVIYNNSEVKADYIDVKDTFPGEATQWTNDTNMENWFDIDKYPSHNWAFMNLKQGEYDSHTYYIKFGEYSSARIIENKAEITGTIPNNNTSYRTIDYDYVQMIPTNVSLQKYIVSVTDQSGKTTNYSRADRKAEDSTTNEISKTIPTSKGTLKSAEPVRINQGDIVTYRITVYNNSEVDAKVLVKDNFPTSATKWYNQNSKKWMEVKDYPFVEIGTGTINAGSFVDIDIKVEFGDYTSDILENKAKIFNSYPSNSSTYRQEDSDYVEMIQPNVSLQKYITNVNGTPISGRADQLESDWGIDSGYGGDNRTISARHTAIDMNPDNNKMTNDVDISYDSEVTYRIEVYNNNNTVAKDIIVLDKLPTCNVDGTLTAMAEVKNVITSNNAIKYQQKDEKNVVFNISEIAANSSVYIDITLKFNAQSVNNIQLKNTAQISNDDNESEYRQIDSDYVTIKKYSVKLEKYVDQEGENYIWDRNGHPIYDEQGFSKESNPVPTEVGNEVIYHIKLTNTGDEDINSITFEDICSDSELEYVRHDTTYGADKLVKAGNKFTYINKLPSEKNNRRNYYTIISITYKVKSTGKIENTAQITQITNTYEIPVTDSDGPENNIDKDWIKTKIYQVSLEKYVSKITSGVDAENISGRENHPKYRQNGYSKEENPVGVEIGDLVTYTIKLTNTGTDTTNYGAIKNLVVTDNCPNGLSYHECSRNVTKNSSNNTFTYTGTLAVGDSATFTITYKVNENAKNIKDLIENTATVLTTLTNKNDITVTDSDGEWNNTDQDWIKIKEIAVSLEKYVSAVNGEDIANRSGMAEYLTIESGVYVDKTETDTKWTRNNETKYDNPVTVKSGDYVTYTIKVTNDGETQVRVNNITDTLPEYGISKYKAGGYSANSNEYNTNLSNRQVELNRTGGVLLNPGDSTIVTITVQVSEPDTSLRILTNNAEVTGFVNKNGIDVDDTTPCNNKDNDYVQLDSGGGDQGPYTSVSVEKVWENDAKLTEPTYIQVQLKKNGTVIDTVKLSEANHWKYLWMNLEKYDIKYDSNGNKIYEEYKYDVCEVNVPEGFFATKDDSSNDNRFIITNSSIKPPEYVSKTVKKEWLYDGNGKDRPEEVTVELQRNGEKYDTVTLNEKNGWTYTWNKLEKHDDKRNEYSYTIKEINIPEHYKVEYTENGNTYIIKNKYDAPDSPDIIIGGYVWNDIALDKQQMNYNAQIDEQERKLEGIKVYLYREGVTSPIAIKHTNSEGYYGFSNSDIDKTVVTEAHKQYIKAEKIAGTQRWNKDKYYSYYVVFEYDGITYTSTPDGKSMEDIINSSKDYTVDSNAREDNAYGKSGLINRTNFNNSINPNSGIEYYTVNEDGYIPQSIHTYKAAMKSSTNIINFTTLLSGKDYNKAEDLEDINDIQNKLKHVGLGLRGRDIFDLELTSDVDNVKVTVNGQQGVYEYNNKVTLRQEDLNPNATTTEDMANIQSEASNTYVDRQYQNIRNSDFDVKKANTNATPYESSQGISAIEVTYKITVHNTSKTKGTATKIINYYDSKYKINEDEGKVAYYYNNSNNKVWISSDHISEGADGTGFKSVVITTPGTMLGQAEKMEIYVVYELDNPSNKLAPLLQEGVNEIPTFNMAEITEYRTAIGENQTEYTRGLIDKDSAPNSANKEQVRLTEGTSNLTTVNYYFAAYRLDKLKYEDDTYATPILYFVIKDDPTDPNNPDDSSDYNRTITGIVFEDETSVDQTTKIKTGNGKLDPGEAPVYGATVELIEVDENGNNQVLRYTTTTNAEGKFKFENFLPGYYIIKYHYGDTTNTVLLNKSTTEGINGKSYNGEDFQATNNTGKAGDTPKDWLNKLDETIDFWYVHNETKGISTATDDIERRKAVSDAVTIFADEEMTVLNNMRAGKSETDSKVTYQHNGDNKEVTVQNIIDKTKMNATTPKMLFTVEETKFENDQLVQRKVFDTYKISNMNFGIAEVPVVTVNLQKQVKAFTITDSTGKNIIARLVKNGSDWDKDGDIYVIDDTLDVSIEDQKLQGARLEVTYDIISDTIVEKNFDKTSPTVATIAGLADYIDNNLSYNENLGYDGKKNSDYWEITTYNDIKADFEDSQYNGGTKPQGVLDPEGNKYTTVVRATDENPILDATDKAVATITLEKVLSSTDSTIDEIITSTVETFVYNNTVEITKLSYGNTGDGQRDRIRTSDRYIIIPGVQYDTATSERIVLHPPTGDSSISTVYYIIAAISLTVLAIGVFGIKKFVVKK